MLLAEVPDNSIVTIGGVGQNQLKMNTMGILFADGTRIGLEDYIYLDQGRNQLATNKQLVTRVVNLAEFYGIKPASTKEVRVKLGLI